MATISRVSVTKNPTSAKVQALICQLQEDRNFGQIGKDWIGMLKLEGAAIIKQIGNVILRSETKKDNILSNSNTLSRERMNCDDCISI